MPSKLSLALNLMVINKIINMVKWYIGCSGFHYKHWKGIFYPVGLPQKKWFDYYCENFCTLELNVTFYRFPELPFLQNWNKRSPGSFTFSVKAPRIITHFKKFNDSIELINELYAVISNGLKNKLGPVLFQLPPRFDYTAERLEKIIGSLNPAFINVLEFRHVSWWQEEVFKELARHNITFCGMSHPSLPDQMIRYTKVVYHRMHGVPHLYRSLYNVASLEKIIHKTEEMKSTKEAFIYFNNDIDGSAIINSKQLIELTSGK